MQSCVHSFFFFCPTGRPTLTRERAMGNKTFYGDGLITCKSRRCDITCTLEIPPKKKELEEEQHIEL